MATPHDLPAARTGRADRRPIALAGDAGARPPAASAPSPSTVPDARRSTGCAASAPTVTHRRRRPGRGQPRLVAAGHDLGARRPGRRRWPRRSCRPDDRRRGRRGPAPSATRPASRSPPPPAAAGSCGGVGPAARRRRARPVRARRHPIGRRRLADRRRARRHLRRPLRGTSCAPSHGVTVGPLAAVDRPLHRRRLARLPRRRSALDPLRQDRGHRHRPRRRPRRRHASIHTGGNARQAVGPDLNQLFVGSEGTLGVITGARLRAAPGARRTSGAPPTASRRSPTALDACRRILRRGATPAVLRLYDDIESDRNFGTGDASTCCSCSTRATAAIVDATMRGRRRGVRAPARTSDDALVEPLARHRNDVVRPRGADLRRARRRHHGDHRAVVRARRRSTRRPSTAIARRRRHARRRRPTSRTPTPTAPASTSPSPARSTPTASDAYYRAVWDAGTRAVLARRRLAQPPPRRRPQPGPLRARGARRRPSTCSPRSRRRSTRTASSTRASSACPSPFGDEPDGRATDQR